MSDTDKPDDKRQRARRGTEQIQREGTDRATGKPRLFARFTTHGKRYHVRLLATGMDEARAELVDLKRRAHAGVPLRDEPAPEPEPALTVRQLAERYCGFVDKKHADNFKSGAGEETRRPKKYRRAFWSVLDCHVLPVLGTKPADEVRRPDVVRMVDALQGTGARTIEKSIRNLSKLFNWAAERELVLCTNPAHRVRGPKYTSKSDYYRDDEVKRLLATAAEKVPDLYPIVATAYYTGMRKGELAALQWGDVDFEGARIDVSRSWDADRRKSGEALTVHMHPHLHAILRAWLAKHPPDSAEALLFPDPVTRGMRDEFDDWALRELVDMAGEVRQFKMPWHSFRHSHGTSLAAAGASLAEIQEALGQSSLEMARRYTKVAAAAVKKRVRALPTLGPAPVVDLGGARGAAGRDRPPVGRSREQRAARK